MLTIHEQLLGFGKGSFKLIKPGEENPNLIEYKLESLDQVIIVGNCATTVQKAVLAQREVDPDCKLVYHNLQWDPTDAQKFTMTQTHRVCFRPNEAVKEVTAANMATKESIHYWTNSATHLVWFCRWTQKGLMPVKPGVYLKGELVLAPKKRCLVPAGTEPAAAGEGCGPGSAAPAAGAPAS